jgi:O-antigen ligase
MDYVEMLFEGGLLFLVAAFVLAWAAAQRLRVLWAPSRSRRADDRNLMACAVCGLGLLGFLLHSLVEFNMRIPANAILAALLAGVYLRPLESESRGR